MSTLELDEAEYWVATVTWRAAGDAHYVAIGPAGRVFRRDPDGTTEPLPRPEADTVNDLLARGRLALGDRCRVRAGRDHSGTGHAVVVPPGSCRLCGGCRRIPINRQARWTPERGVHRPTDISPCPRCHPAPNRTAP